MTRKFLSLSSVVSLEFLDSFFLSFLTYTYSCLFNYDQFLIGPYTDQIFSAKFQHTNYASSNTQAAIASDDQQRWPFNNAKLKFSSEGKYLVFPGTKSLSPMFLLSVSVFLIRLWEHRIRRYLSISIPFCPRSNHLNILNQCRSGN